MKSNRTADKWRIEGNSLFNQGKYRDAVISYNKSLCHAKTGSKQLALAYGNRSAVYLEVKLFDECLLNIQLARENNHPDPEKLKVREEKCLLAQETQPQKPEDDPAEFIKLSYEPNKNYPSIVDCLELRQNEKFGRYVITNRDLNPGDIIAIEEPFLKFIEQVESRYERCINCLDMNKHNLIPSESCTISKSSFLSCVSIAMIANSLSSHVLLLKLLDGLEGKIPGERSWNVC